MAGRVTSISISTRGEAQARTRYYGDKAAVQGIAGYYSESVATWIMFQDQTLIDLGLADRIATDEQVERMFLGLHPTKEEKLGRAGVDNRTGLSVVTSHDWTNLPAPKSVSGVWSMTTPTLQRWIQGRVVAASMEALRYVVTWTPLLRHRTGSASTDVEFVKAKELFGVMYQHTTSRPPGVEGEALTSEPNRPDPNLHVHVLLRGGFDEAGTFRAIEGRQLMLAQRMLAAISTAEMARSMEAFGFRIRRTVTLKRARRRAVEGIQATRVGWEIDGVPDALIEAFSRRTQDIQKLAEEYELEHGVAQGIGWDHAKAESRNRKEHFDHEELVAWWGKRGAQTGFDPTECANLVQAAINRREAGRGKRHLSSRKSRSGAGRILRREILEQVCLERAWVSPHEVVTLALERAVGLIHWRGALSVVADMIEAHDLVVMAGDRVTTSQVLAEEKEIKSAARKLAARRTKAEDVDKAIKRWIDKGLKKYEEEGRPFDPGQELAIRTALSGRALTMVTGFAGSGKTTAARMMVGGFHEQGRRVIALAVAGKRTQSFRKDSGADLAMTVKGFQERVTRGLLKVGAGDVLLVDEGAVQEHQLMRTVLTVAEKAGASVVMMGDDAQLPPVGRGGSWAAVVEAAASTGGAVVLDVNHRALDPREAAAWIAVREGRLLEAVDHWKAEGRFTVYRTRSEMLRTVVDQWMADGQLGMILTTVSNAERDRISNLAQERRLEAGELGTEAIPMGSVQVRPGDRILLNEIIPAVALPRITRTVTLPAKTVTLRSGEIKTFPERTYEREGARQDRIENGTQGTIEAVNASKGTVTIRLQEADREPGQERVITLSASSLPADLAYSGHVYKSQGDTVEAPDGVNLPEVSHVVLDPDMTEMTTMVPLTSRGKGGAHIHTTLPKDRALEDIVRDEAGDRADSRALMSLFHQARQEVEVKAQIAGIVRRDGQKTMATEEAEAAEHNKEGEMVRVLREPHERPEEHLKEMPLPEAGPESRPDWHTLGWREKDALLAAQREGRGWQDRQDDRQAAWWERDDAHAREGMTESEKAALDRVEMNAPVERFPEAERSELSASVLPLDSGVLLAEGDRVQFHQNSVSEHLKVEAGAEGKVIDIQRGGPNLARVQLGDGDDARVVTLYHNADVTAFADIEADRPAAAVVPAQEVMPAAAAVAEAARAAEDQAVVNDMVMDSTPAAGIDRGQEHGQELAG